MSLYNSRIYHMLKTMAGQGLRVQTAKREEKPRQRLLSAEAPSEPADLGKEVYDVISQKFYSKNRVPTTDPAVLFQFWQDSVKIAIKQNNKRRKDAISILATCSEFFLQKHSRELIFEQTLDNRSEDVRFTIQKHMDIYIKEQQQKQRERQSKRREGKQKAKPRVNLEQTIVRLYGMASRPCPALQKKKFLPKMVQKYYEGKQNTAEVDVDCLMKVWKLLDDKQAFDYDENEARELLASQLDAFVSQLIGLHYRKLGFLCFEPAKLVEFYFKEASKLMQVQIKSEESLKQLVSNYCKKRQERFRRQKAKQEEEERKKQEGRKQTGLSKGEFLGRVEKDLARRTKQKEGKLKAIEERVHADARMPSKGRRKLDMKRIQTLAKNKRIGS